MHKNEATASRARQTIGNLRFGFIGMAVLAVVIGTALAWHSWDIEREREQLYLSSLVEITGKSLNDYFRDHQRDLQQLAQKVAALENPERNPHLFELLQQFRLAHPDYLHVVLVRPDGVRLLADEYEAQGLPAAIGDTASFRQAVQAFDAGLAFDIGRAVAVGREGVWTLPMRSAVRDRDARLRYILSATLPLAHQQHYWRDTPMPRDSAFGLLRDDGYMVSRYPAPKAMDYAEAYGKPRTGQLREYLVQQNFPVRGVTEGYNSVAKASYLFAFHRLADFPLTVFISTPVAYVQDKWLQQMRFPGALLFALLLGGYLVYRWARLRQLAWETERERNEERIAHLAQHDYLTGLPNRLLAEDRLRQAVAHAGRERTRVALLYLDLDNFKSINDALGHGIGDALLKAVALRLNPLLRGTDTLSRLGGDEFLIILPDIPQPDDVSRVADGVLERLNAPFTIEHHQLSISVSVGIAIHPDDGGDFGTLLRKADTAMYSAKASGRNTYRFHTEQMNLEAGERLRVRNWLGQALEQNRFVLHYQPQVDLACGSVIGAEALIRLQHPSAGLVMPARFIGVAEDCGLIVPVGRWVLREACRQLAAWRAAGWRDLVMAVNLSPAQFRQADLESSVLAALAEFDVPAANLELELTESLLLDNAELVLGTMQRLKGHGLRLSIDDFGTGYSSLAYLKRFSVDRLKIDRSFVGDLLDDPEDAAIVRAIIQLANSLGIEPLAEGVEDEATRALLGELGCRTAQGFLFSRPVEAEAFAAYLARAAVTRGGLPPAV